MSSAALPANVPATGTFALWKSQALSILWMELRRNFITRRGFWIYLLAAAPAILVWVHSIVTMNQVQRSSHDIQKDTMIMAVLFQVFFLRPGVFFGCVGIFTYLFRGEFVERSLHYYFLAPVRREVLVLAKYLAGAITAICFFGLGVVLTFTGMYAHFPGYQVQQFLYEGGGLSHLGWYVLITTLASLAWGSVFLYMGIRFKNPIIPAVSFLLWESINVFLPSWLRRVSVLHYLQSLNPVQVTERGPGALLGMTLEPENAGVAIAALLLISVGMVLLSMRELRRTEISYSTD
jgi:ABC-type transport system involved in multi-copper enzyme maturation permease subunit